MLGRPGLDAIQPLGVVAALFVGCSAILDRVEVVMSLEDEFEIDISDDEAWRLQTVGDVLACITANVSKLKARTPALQP